MIYTLTMTRAIEIIALAISILFKAVVFSIGSNLSTSKLQENRK